MYTHIYTYNIYIYIIYTHYIYYNILIIYTYIMYLPWFPLGTSLLLYLVCVAFQTERTRLEVHDGMA